MDTITIILAMMLSFVVGYFLAYFQGVKNERIKWVRWVLSGIEQVHISVEDKKEKEVVEDMLRRV